MNQDRPSSSIPKLVVSQLSEDVVDGLNALAAGRFELTHTLLPTTCGKTAAVVSSFGLSPLCCEGRSRGIPVVHTSTVRHVLSEISTGLGPTDEDRFARASPLRPFEGYSFSLSGFKGEARSSIQRDVEALGGIVQPHLDYCVSILLVPWTSWVECGSCSEKMRFALKNGIPIFRGMTLLNVASDGRTSIDKLRSIYQLLPQGDDDIENPLNSSVMSSTLMPAPMSRKVTTTDFFVGLSDEDVAECCLPIVFVVIGSTYEERVQCKRWCSAMDPTEMLQQPVLTTSTTHVVLGSTFEKMLSTHDQQTLMEFLSSSQRISQGNVKTMRWLEELCSEASLVALLRLHYDAHSVPFSILKTRDVNQEYDGALPERKRAASEAVAAAKSSMAPPPPPQREVQRAENAQQSSAAQKNDESRHVPSKGIDPKQLVIELRHLHSDVCSSGATSSSGESCGPEEMLKDLARMAAISNTSGTTLSIFHQFTFLVEEPDETRRSSISSSDDKGVSNQQRQDLLKEGGGHLHTFSLHRLAALRSIIKVCGGTLIRKTRAELVQMFEEKHELLRMKRTSDGDRVWHTAALLPHSFERDCSDKRYVSTEPSNSQQSLRQAKKGRTTVIQLHSIGLPCVTSTWILSCLAAHMLLPLKPPASRNRPLTGEDVEQWGWNFLQYRAAVHHPHADLLTLDPAPAGLSRTLPDEPSAFLSSKRYIKRRLQEAGAFDHVAAVATRGDLGQGVRILGVEVLGTCGSPVTYPSKAHLHQVTQNLGGELRWINDDNLPSLNDDVEMAVMLATSTHVVVDGARLEANDIADRFVLALQSVRPELRRLLETVFTASLSREDIVFVSVAWLRRCCEVGYFISDAGYHVHLVGVEHEGSDHSHVHLSPRLDEALSASVSALERSVGDGGGSSRRSKMTKTTTKNVLVKEEKSLDVNGNALDQKESAVVAHARVLPPPVVDLPVASERPTAAHNVGYPGPACTTLNTTVHEPRASAPCRVYMLSTVPDFAALKAAVTQACSSPDVGLCSTRLDDNASKTLVIPSWTHIVFVATVGETDVVVANEVTQRESVLHAIAAGLWVVEPRFLWQCAEQHRIVDISPYEWNPSMLTDSQRQKQSSLMLATNVAHWRCMMQQSGVGAFSQPCILEVCMIAQPLHDVFGAILRAGGAVVDDVGKALAASDCEKRSDAYQCFEEVAFVIERVLGDATRSSPAVMECSSPIVVLLVTKLLWSRWGTELSQRVSAVCSAHKQWRQQQHQQSISYPVAQRPEEEKETKNHECHYAGHNQIITSPSPTCASAAVHVEIFFEDWISLTLQRRMEKLKAPLFVAEA